MDFLIAKEGLKLFRINYPAGSKIPAEEFRRQDGLLGEMLESGAVVESDEAMDLFEATDFNKKAKAAEERASAVPDLQDLDWQEAVNTVMSIKASATLVKLQSQENKRLKPRKSVMSAIATQLRTYGG